MLWTWSVEGKHLAIVLSSPFEQISRQQILPTSTCHVVHIYSHAFAPVSFQEDNFRAVDSTTCGKSTYSDLHVSSHGLPSSLAAFTRLPLSCRILSYPVVSYPIVSYPILPYPTLPYPTLPYPIAYLVLSCPVLSCPVVSFPVVSPPLLARRQQKNTASVYASYVTSQSLTLCELLEAFSSCKPRPGTLLALLPPLPPRYYSVASSQLATPDSVTVAFSVVSFRLPHHAGAGSNGAGTGDGEGFVTRRGLCTNWLEGILAPFLEGGGVGGGGAGVSVPVFLKPTKEFLLPASAKWPCVLIGPGTG